MKLIRLALCSLTLIMTAAALSQAETFYLKDGNKVSGDIVSHEDGIYTVNTSFGIVDIPDTNIDRISDKSADEENETKQIQISSTEIKRNYVPEYEDEKYHDPLYIAYSQAKVSATALTASGAVMLGLGVLIGTIALPVYFSAQNLGNQILSDCGSDNNAAIDKIGLALVLPWFVAPASIGFILLMACIGPWVYASKMLYKWQSKYHVHMSMADSDKLELGLSISL